MVLWRNERKEGLTAGKGEGKRKSGIREAVGVDVGIMGSSEKTKQKRDVRMQ